MYNDSSKIDLYAMLDSKNDRVYNVFMSPDDRSAVLFILRNHKKVFLELPNEELRNNMLEELKADSIVKLGSVNTLARQLENDYKIIFSFSMYDMKEFWNLLKKEGEA